MGRTKVGKSYQKGKEGGARQTEAEEREEAKIQNKSDKIIINKMIPKIKEMY